MRSFGLALMVLGIFGFFYASSRSSGEGPSAETSVSDSMRTEAGRWELARYGAAGAAAVGALLALFPKGR